MNDDDVEIEVHKVPVDPGFLEPAQRAKAKLDADRAGLDEDTRAAVDRMQADFEHRVLYGDSPAPTVQREPAATTVEDTLEPEGRIAELAAQDVARSRTCRVDLALSDTPGQLVVIVTARLYEGEADWWVRAARHKAWVVDTREAAGLALVQATQTFSTLMRAERVAGRARRQIDRSLDRFYREQTS